MQARKMRAFGALRAAHAHESILEGFSGSQLAKRPSDCANPASATSERHTQGSSSAHRGTERLLFAVYHDLLYCFGLLAVSRSPLPPSMRRLPPVNKKILFSAGPHGSRHRQRYAILSRLEFNPGCESFPQRSPPPDPLVCFRLTSIRTHASC